MTIQTVDRGRVERWRLGALHRPPLRLAGLVVVPMLAISVNAFGQADYGGYGGPGHPEIYDWYRDLKQPGSAHPCCNGDRPGFVGDCRPTRAYIDDDGRWHATLDGQWVPVPPRVILDQKSPDGVSHSAPTHLASYAFFAAARSSDDLAILLAASFQPSGADAERTPEAIMRNVLAADVALLLSDLRSCSRSNRSSPSTRADVDTTRSPDLVIRIVRGSRPLGTSAVRAVIIGLLLGLIVSWLGAWRRSRN